MPEPLFLKISTAARLIFPVLWCVAFAVLLAMWLSTPYIDETLWSHAAQEIAHGTLPALSSPTPVHPGTALLLPAALVMQLPINAGIAYHIALSALMALVIIFATYTCFLLRPKSMWWVGTFILLTVNALYLDATAPSAFASVLTALFVLLVLRIREHPSSSYSLLFLGLCGGVLLATRIDVGSMFVSLSFPYIWHIAGKRALVVLVIAGFIFCLFDPYLYINAFKHIHEISTQINTNRTTIGVFGYARFAIFLPAISFLFAFVYVFARPNLTSLPRDYLLWLIAITEIFCGLLFVSSYHPLRYFLPFISAWEVFLMLFVLEYVAQEPSFRNTLKRPEYWVLGVFLILRVVQAILFYTGSFYQFSLQEYLLDVLGNLPHWLNI